MLQQRAPGTECVSRRYGELVGELPGEGDAKESPGNAADDDRHRGHERHGFVGQVGSGQGSGEHCARVGPAAVLCSASLSTTAALAFR